jgi:CheY-like chemotaxis protein
MARILVIDDNELVRMAIGAVLRRAGHCVAFAGDGAEGISAYRAGGFDLVITDIVMPRMEGIETVRALRDENGIVKIIAMSGCTRDGAAIYLAAAQALGADASLVKPFTPEELRRVVRLALCKPAAARRGAVPLS